MSRFAGITKGFGQDNQLKLIDRGGNPISSPPFLLFSLKSARYLVLLTLCKVFFPSTCEKKE